MSNSQLSALVGHTGKLIFVNRWGDYNELNGKIIRSEDGKFYFHVNGNGTIPIQVERVKEFVELIS